MAETFNPYTEWLGVRSAAARPNHYELLRLKPFEADPEAIHTAANMQMAKVRAVRPGDHSEEWRRVLDELGTAKQCLTDFFEKTQYDAGLREKGWPDRGTSSSNPGEQNQSGGAQTTSQSNPATGEKKSPYMEVTNHSVSNPLPPHFGAGKNAGQSSAESSGNGNSPSSGQPTNSSPWQPGTNLMPPSPRGSSDTSAANKPTGGPPANAGQPASGPARAWIPAPVSDKAWTPPSPSAAKSAHAPAAPISSSAAPPPSAVSPPTAPKPKLQFPGETVPVAPAPSAPTTAPPSAPIPSTPAPGFAPAPAFPNGMPQPGAAFNLFPRPFPPSPMPQGATPPSGMPQPQMPMPQQPFGGQFFPGGPLRPGVNPQFPQAAPGAFGAPNYFPHPPAAPHPYAPMPMPPGGMPGYYPQPTMPGFAGGYPQQAVPPQAMPPQQMPPQQMPTQQMPPQPMAAAAGPSFLDDVLSGPTRGGQAAFDELGFGDAPTAQQPPDGWQPNNFSQSGAVADPGGFGQAPPQFAQAAQLFEQSPPPVQPDFDPAAEDTTHGPTYRTRATAPASQNSRTLLIGGALAAVVLLACVLIAAVVLKQKDAAVALNDTTENGSADPQPKNTNLPIGSRHDSNSKTRDSNMHPTADPAAKPPVATPANNTPKTIALEQPTPKTNQPTRPTPLLVQPTMPDPTKPNPAKPAADPAKAAKLNHLLADIRRKLAERNQEEASRLMAEATPLAITAEQTDRVQRMGTLVRYVGEFWGAVHDALGGLKPTDEIELGEDKAVVVEKDDQSLTIRMAGGNHRISLREMPSGFAVALANRWLDPSKPQNKVFVGAFYAVDPKHGPDDARQMWSEAAAAGVTDGTYLLPLLNPEPVAADTAGGDMDTLAAVPDVKAIERVSLKVKEEFDDAISSATTPTKQGELVQKLFDAADSSDEPVKKYVLLVDARDIAARAGRAKLTIEAVDRLAKDFRIDALDMKADTFSNYPPTTPAGGREVMHAAMALVEEALSAKRLPLASRLAQVAVAAAQVSGANGLIKQAAQRSKEIDALASK